MVHKIFLPLKGNVINLNKSCEPVFASEALGKGIAVFPLSGDIYAPDNGVVTMFFKTLHAIGLTFDNGVEMLIHVGVNTVELNGKYFKKHTEQGRRIQKGDKLLSFDIQKIVNAKYDPTTFVIITNSNQYLDFEVYEGENMELYSVWGTIGK